VLPTFCICGVVRLSKFWSSEYIADVTFGGHGTLWWFYFPKANDLQELTVIFDTLEV
jgi:hypothetical protein